MGQAESTVPLPSCDTALIRYDPGTTKTGNNFQSGVLWVPPNSCLKLPNYESLTNAKRDRACPGAKPVYTVLWTQEGCKGKSLILKPGEETYFDPLSVSSTTDPAATM